ncbi:phenylalanine--tRNA ligase subunit alpha [Candidatus Poribacteria bacterium]|nr:MAG: phenylalanine--tRNA ligase subunit alpha [Candidatus Poribacteria bacterium]
MELERELESLEGEIADRLKSVSSLEELDSIRVEYLGRKGKLTALLRRMGQLPPELRPVIGRKANELRQRLESAIQEKAIALKEEGKRKRLAAETIDITLPGRRPALGVKHPITQTLERIKEIFVGMGFEVVEGPEIETEYYNFEALNTPWYHPARDMQDTFYITDSILLRTQTSPVQIRVMESRKPPIRIIAPGKVYRRDADISHSPMFHQVEGLLVDRHVTFAELKGVLAAFARQMFGPETKVRFRPSFFPFTEPSAEVDISCIICGGKGCQTCGWTGWMEILGAGSVDPEVFKAVGYDPEEVTGFAFGMGVERIAMLKFGINDIRLFFENDIRFLSQF